MGSKPNSVKNNILFALNILLVAGLLSACAEVQSTMVVPPIQNPNQSTLVPESMTPYPTRPIYPPGTLVDYTAQNGDNLVAIASHFNTTVEEILEANPLLPKTITTLQAGFQMKISIYYEALWGSQFQIIPDALFVNGPAQTGFDVKAYVESQPGWLKDYTVFADEHMRTGGELIELVAQNFSISPKVLLALAEYQTGALTQPVLADNLKEYPLGYEDQYHKGFYLQLVWAASLLNNGYYKWRNGNLDVINRSDGTLEIPDPWQNAATIAFQHYFSQRLPINVYNHAIHENGFIETYISLFGDPWLNVQPHIPGNLQQVDLVFPFAAGKTWAFTGGPHESWWGSGEPYGALDFAPATSAGGCGTTDEFVVAMAPGLIVRTEPAIAVLDLDMDGNERTGWVIYYLHLGLNDMVSQGKLVKTGDTIGHPSCEGGSATGTHIHVARKYNGEWITADGAVPFNIEGWIAKNGSRPYLGTLTRKGNVITASETASGRSAITAGIK
ncbi:LysM peptidoglycan-binding domain-containing protein [bacterium]|nr:LysM peptidoglycan-binding domain-containing protein [bacterium]